MKADQFAAAVRMVVDALPSGSVASYGQVAVRAGYPGAARAVGSALTADMPWWRVVRSDGCLTQGERQARLLRSEGVEIAESRLADARLRRGLRPTGLDSVQGRVPRPFGPRVSVDSTP